MLEKAERTLLKFSESNRTEPIRLPSQLTPNDRQALHQAAERLGVDHKSEGVGVQRCLVFSRRRGTTFVLVKSRYSGQLCSTDSSRLDFVVQPKTIRTTTTAMIS